MQITLKIPVTNDEIKEETSILRQQIALRDSEIQLLRDAIRHYQKQCTHPGQQTGYNEREGNWATPCPICGDSR